MQGLSAAVDLAPLVGCQLTQLCFGAWNVAMIFDRGIRIVVESTIAMNTSSPAVSRIDNFREYASVLCEAIGLDVVDAVRTEEGGLAIRFASGLRWTIENSEAGYESFQLHFGDRIFVA